MGELQERMQKLKAEAKEHDKEEGVWLENSRMLIDYNFKHGVLDCCLALLPWLLCVCLFVCCSQHHHPKPMPSNRPCCCCAFCLPNRIR